MAPQNHLYFCTGNKHKFMEVKKYIENYFPKYEVTQKDLPIKELQAETLEEIAEFKIKSIIDFIKPPYFIEDAGFFVDDELKGFPGVYSSYVMKTIGYDGILKLLKDKKERKAHFKAVIAYMDLNFKMHLFSGEVFGNVSINARGQSGFGFDPIFIPNENNSKTFAEMEINEKNSISHRTRAMKKFVEYLSKEV